MSGELAVAKDAAVQAASLVTDIVASICQREILDLADEVAAAMERYWSLDDRLAGFLLIDEARPGGPLLRELQEEIVDRKRRAQVENPLYMEQHNWHGYLSHIEEAQRQKWVDYMRRLSRDPHARFEVKEPV